MHGTWPHVSDGMRSKAPPSNGGPPCPHGHALQRLACVARDARGRACLLGAGAPAHLGELLAPARVLWQESRGPDSAAAAQLLGLLLVLRNLCAAGSAATAALLRCSAPAQVAALVLLLAPRAPPPAAQPGVRRGLAARRAGCSAPRPADRGRAPGSAKLLVVAAQLLANLAASSAEAARSVWAACEPGAFLALARVPDGAGGRVAAPPARLQRRGGGRRLTDPLGVQAACTARCAAPCTSAAWRARTLGGSAAAARAARSCTRSCSTPAARRAPPDGRRGPSAACARVERGPPAALAAGRGRRAAHRRRPRRRARGRARAGARPAAVAASRHGRRAGGGARHVAGAGGAAALAGGGGGRARRQARPARMLARALIHP